MTILQLARSMDEPLIHGPALGRLSHGALAAVELGSRSSSLLLDSGHGAPHPQPLDEIIFPTLPNLAIALQSLRFR
jgi:hypothetical protein